MSNDRRGSWFAARGLARGPPVCTVRGMSSRKRSALLLGLVVALLLAGYLLQKLEPGEAPPSIPDSDLTPAVTVTAAPGDSATPRPTRPATSPSPTAAPASGAVRDLEQDEARGGHTLARHVGKSDAELAARLKAERDISAASTYTDRDAAGRAVGTVLAKKSADVAKWEQRTGSRSNLALRYRLDTTVGRSLKRGASTPVDVRSVVVVLKWDGDGWYVLTSYPEDR